MNDKIKNWIILSLVLLSIILLSIKGCSPKPEPAYIKGVDSIAYDTVPRPYEVIKWKTKTILIADSMKHEPEDTIPIIPITRYYNDSTADSNVVIHTHIKTKGTLEELGISYRLLTPLEIHKTITRTDTLIKAPKISLYGGIGVSGNSSYLDINPYLSLNYRGKNIHVSYGIFKKDIEMGIGFPIYKSKQ